MDKDTFNKEYSEYWEDSPRSLLDKYNYQEQLTKKLDRLDVDAFSKYDLYEIVLWKLNRYPVIEDDVIDQLKELSRLSAGEHEKGRDVLGELLSSHGVRLPMASTILRFINSEVFQIIDDRAYRVLCPGEKMYPYKPPTPTKSYIENSVEIYFAYLSKLREICSDVLPFSKSDRILYQLSIEKGDKIGG